MNAIASDIQTILHTLMDDDRLANNRYSIKELRDRYRKDDIIVKVTGANGSASSAVIEIIYDNVIEWDRRPQSGKMPSVAEIKEWAQAKGLKTDNPTINLIRRSLWWNGYSGQPLWDALEKEIDKRMEKEWNDLIFETISRELERYF